MPKANKSKKGPRFWAVKIGRQPGVYETWPEAEAQVMQFPGAVHRSFKTYGEAESYVGALVDYLPIALSKAGRSTAAPKQSGNVALTKTRSTSPLDPPLSEQQALILSRILQGENFFFTGSAGTGKSVLLRAIIRAFKEKAGTEEEKRDGDPLAILNRTGKDKELGDSTEDGHQRWNLGVTASTGMAGVNIGGSTLHSWAGVGLGELKVDKLVEIVKKNKMTLRRWRNTGALIIDEVSMIDGHLFDKLEEIGRKIRGNDKPFGGLQVILSGDFFQLPPVAKKAQPVFAFDAKSWSRVIPPENMLGLTRVFRQKEDRFIRILEAMRLGQISAEDVATLQELSRAVEYPLGIEPVGLYPQKKQVAEINSTRLAALASLPQFFISWDMPGVNSAGRHLSDGEATESLDKNTVWPKELSLKVGAMVMLVVNLQEGGLVNGSTGLVVDFMTIPDAVDQGVLFPNSAAHFSPARDVAWPVVEFIPSKHAGVRQAKRVIIPQMAVDVLNAQGDPEATRHQVPLILAWALTIHKSQGQTIERVKIDLKDIFVEGQTYVAVSRAVSLETLELQNFRMDKVMAHPRVIEWARPLEMEQAEEELWDDLRGRLKTRGAFVHHSFETSGEGTPILTLRDLPEYTQYYDSSRGTLYGDGSLVAFAEYAAESSKMAQVGRKVPLRVGDLVHPPMKLYQAPGNSSFAKDMQWEWLLKEFSDTSMGPRPLTTIFSHCKDLERLGPRVRSGKRRGLWLFGERMADGTCRIELASPQVPGTLNTGETVTAFVERACQSLKAGFKPSWWLQNGHAQTIYSAVADLSHDDRVVYQRGVDIFPPLSTVLPDTAPVVIINHGLTGGSHESYVRKMAVWVAKPWEEGGLGGRTAVVNLFPNSPFLGVGFSLGAGVMTRYLGEQGDDCRLLAATVLCAPLELKQMSEKLDSPHFFPRLYSFFMARKMLRSLSPHLVDPSPLSGYDSPLHSDLPTILGLAEKTPWTLRASKVTELIVAKVGGAGPHFPFEGMDNFHEWACPGRWIRCIKRPTLGLSALDDPILAGGEAHITLRADVRLSPHWQCPSIFALCSRHRAERWPLGMVRRTAQRTGPPPPLAHEADDGVSSRGAYRSHGRDPASSRASRGG
ncbi:ATP-dependent DNA helicase PIF1, partial [Tremellales sp. Uapishka_1]